MLTSHVMDHDMNVHIQILLGYLQPVHLSDQRHLILGLGHHQSSSLTTFVSIVYFDKT